ncbi:hypothetical protein BB558_000098 [Smittium angustum]|uniref:Transcription factor domain-containing protein n=1 Tax=Smittium angustum TaxID=133377 RepID=A0A2U1JFM9_SMIAN|nr:hypothetical protein BB558_000098 [Smittium angustum]
MYDISKDSNPEIFNDIKYGLPIPNSSKLQELCLILPHVFPTLTIPMRFFEFTNGITNRKYPYYFIFSVLAVGIKRIKTSRTQQDKTLETLYAQKSLELMKLDKSFDPLIIWACSFILGYSTDTNDQKSSNKAIDINNNTERIIQKYNDDEMEFRRRVWWVYYNRVANHYMFNGNYITFEQRDIVVNPPRNDFKWRYGGDIGECDNKELKILNHKANCGSESDFPHDYYYLIVNVTSLRKNITTFVTKRWRKDRLNEDQTNMRLIFYIDKLQKFKNEIDKIFEEKIPQTRDIYIKYKGTIKLILDTESYLFGYLIKSMYYSTLIYLYQSELIRDFNLKISPERVQAAKLQCINASVDQMNLVESYIKYVPANYQEHTSIFKSMDASITFSNFFFINDPTIKEKYVGYYNRMVSVYNSFGKNSDVISSLNLFIKYIIDVKTKANEQNKKLKHLHKNMAPFGISESDIDPWIAPKYGSPFHLQCCGKGNFSILDISEYLEEKITTTNIFAEDNHADAYEQVIKSPIIEINLDNKEMNRQLDKANNYPLNFGNIPVIKKTVLLKSNDKKYVGYYNRMVSVYNSFGKNSDVISSLNLFIKYIIDVKTKANEQNKKLKHLHKNMAPFGISESDIDPWIAPKYGSPFHLQCCGKGNFSILDISEYLEEKITTTNIFAEDNHADAYEQVIKSPIIEINLDNKEMNRQLDKANNYPLNFGNIPVIKKTVLLKSNDNMDSFMSFLANTKQESPRTKKESNIASEPIQTTSFNEEIGRSQYIYGNTTLKISKSTSSNKKAKLDKMDIKNLLN